VLDMATDLPRGCARKRQENRQKASPGSDGVKRYRELWNAQQSTRYDRTIIPPDDKYVMLVT
jgi:hypothetical protein